MEEQGNSGPVLGVLSVRHPALPRSAPPWRPACCRGDSLLAVGLSEKHQDTAQQGRRRRGQASRQGPTHFGSTLTTFSEYLMFGELLLSEKQISSMVRATNLSFKSFSRLYFAERFSLKGEGKSSSLWKAQVAPTVSWEALEDEATAGSSTGWWPFLPTFYRPAAPPSPIYIRCLVTN